MPRFVILAHDWPTPHFDLLMQCGEVLRSWRLHADPSFGEAVLATANGDHRLHYLDYEGEVSGRRGQVRRIDAGEYDGELGTTFAVAWQGRVTGRAVMAEVASELRFRILTELLAPASREIDKN